MKPLHEQLKEAIEKEVFADYSMSGGLYGLEGTEEAATACAEIVKEYALNFANWKIKNRWTYFIADGAYYNKEDRTVANKDELFALFLKETESNQQEGEIKEPEVKQESEEQLWREAEMLLPRNYGDMFENQNPNSYKEVQLHFKIERRK